MSGRILVIDDVETNRVILRTKLASQYYSVLLAESGYHGLDLATREEPDVILLDVVMPDIDGFEVCRRLKADPCLAHIPVVMITALNSPEERLRGLEVGADDFLSRPLCDLALFARVRNLMRSKLMFDELRLRDRTCGGSGPGTTLAEGDALIASGGSSVLFVSDPPEEAQDWATRMGRRLGIRTMSCDAGQTALNIVREAPPDAIVISQQVRDGVDGRQLLAALRSHPDTRQSAILFAVQGEDFALAAQVLDLGASDYFHTPPDPAELAARLRAQLRRKLISDGLRSTLRDGLRLAMVDPLTGLFNRRYALHHLERIVARARATGRGFATMMLDLDSFKSVNDRYGHPAGDAVLRQFADRLRETVRGEDLVARLGGEEFFVAMPDVDARIAAQVAERMRVAVESAPFVVDGVPEGLSVTVSIGVSVGHHPEPLEVAELINRADAALYASKHGGRNMVTVVANAA
ncbi:PleD family two-component system response regulator [Paroceanicella profunda]|uniref:diguanylate cyclase n=1 Tax=Paroceanicella profunda TaxID=2579971 RepID=A0A5B8FG28_9RHOB|nr:PleD family two-component system response regulator [Paroceanicella profunda]QDL90338.1 PleD family two-component system response regulator [Paroceanicella profunda]